MGFFDKQEKPKGLIETYDVIYRGGHPNYPKAKVGKIVFNLFKSSFELISTTGSAKWFRGFSISYDKIIDLKIVEGQVGTAEGLLAGLNSRQLNQPNNIHIKYEDEDNNEILLRLEMLSGVTAKGKARKCLEFQAVIRLNNIRKQFINIKDENISQPQNNIQPGSIIQSQNIDDIASIIEKLALLSEKGIITKEEFQTKKTELIARI